jgi:hypothetical protein
MTIDSTHPSRATRQGLWPAAGAVEAPGRVRRRGRRDPRSTSDASLATSRWCPSRDCRRRATLECPYCCCRCCCRSRQSRCSFLSLSLSLCLCRHCWGLGQEGEGPPEGMVVPAVVGAEAAAVMEGTLLLRAQSRTWRPIPGP